MQQCDWIPRGNRLHVSKKHAHLYLINYSVQIVCFMDQLDIPIKLTHCSKTDRYVRSSEKKTVWCVNSESIFSDLLRKQRADQVCASGPVPCADSRDLEYTKRPNLRHEPHAISTMVW